MNSPWDWLKLLSSPSNFSAGGASWTSAGATGGYGALLDRSAQLSTGRGGGSLTGLLLVDTLQQGAQNITVR